MKNVFHHYNLECVTTRHQGKRWFAFVGLHPSPALNGWDFPTLQAIKAAIAFLSDNCYRVGAYRLVWIFAVNPDNYSEVYGRLTPKRLALRDQYLRAT